MNIANPNYLLATVLLESLRKCGARYAVISPGSRSTPLARTALLMEGMECEVVLDERAAGFYALGMAKAAQSPVILICTSGTASAHYFPAVIEAAQSFNSLILLTADRPEYLRNSGALQTIEQRQLFAPYIRQTIETPEPELTSDFCRATERCTERACLQAFSELRRPAHINVPLDEPLVPIEQERATCEKLFSEWQRGAHVKTRPPTAKASEHEAAHILRTLGTADCGLIVAGPDAARNDEEAELLHHFARQLGWPVFADAVSGLRMMSDPVIPFYDLFLRDAELAAIAPDLILKLGGVPTSKALARYLERHGEVKRIRLQPRRMSADYFMKDIAHTHSGWQELISRLTAEIEVARDSLLLEPFSRAAASFRQGLHAHKASGNACEMEFAQAALEWLPDGSNLALASSLPLRYGDMLCCARGVHVNIFAQRGTNGIDGAIAHAAGIAKASGKRTLLMTGDLALLHDLTSLSIARRVPELLTILLFNNNGGGIFSLLPAAKFTDTFETLHGTPHNLPLEKCADLFGLDWKHAKRPEDIAGLLDSPVSEKLRVIEVRSKRADSVAGMRSFIAELLRGLQV